MKLDDWKNAKRYAISRNDGGVSIAVFRGDVEEEIEKWEACTNFKCVSYVEINQEDIPTDRSNRNTWTADII